MSDEEGQNPYKPPVDTQPGRYEWPLRRRIVYAGLAIAIIYLACATAASWRWYRDVGPRDQPLIQQIANFLTDWRDGSDY